MKTMRSLLLLLALPVMVYAQANESFQARQANLEDLSTANPANTSAMTFDYSYRGVKGTPYRYDSWQKGVIWTRKDKTIEVGMLNIHLVDQILLAAVSPGNAAQIPADSLKRVVVAGTNDMVFVPLPVEEVEGQAASNKKGGRSAFYELLAEGRLSLYKRTEKPFMEANYKGAYSADRPYDEYMEENHYYVLHDGEYVEVKPRRRSIEKALPAFKTQIRELVKAENLDLTTDEGMKELFRLLNGA